MNEQSTIKHWLDWGVQELDSASDSPLIDARTLLGFVCQLTAVDLITKAHQTLAPALADNYRQMINKRKDGQPVAYLTGTKEFWSLKLKVSPDTLIPRPETELLVETAMQQLAKSSTANVLDLGTGSGAIALAIASECPEARVTATDYSPAALEIAEFNARSNNINNVHFVRSDWFEGLSGGTFNLIVSNPPYVAKGDVHLSQGDVRFEPQQALISGVQGLDDLKQIITRSIHYLSNQGWLMVEHGYDQCDSVAQLFNEAGFDQVENITDLNQQPRVTLGQRTV